MVKIKTRNRKPSHHQLQISNNTMSHIAIGAAAGCVIGAAAALFLVPKKKGYHLTEELESLYDQFSDTAGEYAHGALEKGQKAYKTAKNSAGNICSAASHIFSKPGNNSNRNLILGIIGAGVLGASAVYALTQESNHGKSFMDKWKTSKWSEMAELVVDTVSSKLNDGESNAHHPIQNVMDWAVTGLNLWQEIKKRR